MNSFLGKCFPTESICFQAFKNVRQIADSPLKRLVMARQYQKPFNCLNDNLDHDGGENSIASYFLLEQFYEEYFPDQSPMEKFNYYPHDLYADLI